MDMKAFSDENVARCTAPNGFNHPLDSWTLDDWLVATMGELGEAANVLKKLNRVRDGIPGNSETPDMLVGMLADELADTYMYVDLTCRSLGMNTPWPTPAGSAPASVSSAMVGAGIAMGRMCHAALIDRKEGRLVALAAHALVYHLNEIASIHGIDLQAAIRNKFDRTSLKIGYTNQPTGGRHPSDLREPLTPDRADEAGR
jgi:NTP pyrophosphatase (non-canonical NTP hydrolase)